MMQTDFQRANSQVSRRSHLFGVWLLAVLVLAVLGPRCEAAKTQAPAIADSFEAFWSEAQNQPFEQQLASWDRWVERPRQDVYTHVVWETDHQPDWRERRLRQLRQRFADYRQIAARIPPAARALNAEIPARVAAFRKLFPDASATPSVQVLLAPNFDAKSGVLGEGKPVLAFAIDSLLLEHADLDVIFPHELFHLYHSTHAGVQNDVVMTGADLTLPLFAEGLATYVSSVIAPEHDDGALLLQPELASIAQTRLAELARRFLADADQRAIDHAHPDAFRRWFNAGAARYQPDLPNRTGYWLGLAMVRHLREHHSLRELASWSPAQAQRQTRAMLVALAGDKPLTHQPTRP